MYKFLFTFLFVLIHLVCFSQNLSINNQKTFGGNAIDIANSGIVYKSGIVVGGYSNTHLSGDKTVGSNGSYDYWIARFDSSLNKIWEKVYGGTKDDYLTQIIQTKDNNILCVGYSNSASDGNKTAANKGITDFWVIKLDSNGNELWQKTYGGSSADAFPNAVESKNGSLYFFGSSLSEISGDKTDSSRGGIDFWLIKTDANGNINWDKTIGGSGTDIYGKITISITEEIILSGISDSDSSGEKTENSYNHVPGVPGSNSDDLWILKLDTSGNILWDKTYGGTEQESGGMPIVNNNKIYVISSTKSGISGNKTAMSNGGVDMWLLCLHMNGNMLWEESYGGSDDDAGGFITTDSENNILLGGNSISNISGNKTENRIGNFDYWIINLDTIGNINWQKTIGGSNFEALSGIIHTHHNKLVLTGYSDSDISGNKTENSRGDFDFWLVELTYSTVGITEKQRRTEHFKIYPNPASEKAFAALKDLPQGKLTLKAMDMSGKVIFNKSITKDKTEINLSRLTSGTYIFSIFSKDQLLGTEKIFIE